jgi:hypothetical protein
MKNNQNDFWKKIKEFVKRIFNSFLIFFSNTILGIFFKFLFRLLKNNLARIRIFGGFTSLVFIIYKYSEIFKDLGPKTLVLIFTGGIFVVIFENIDKIFLTSWELLIKGFKILYSNIIMSLDLLIKSFKYLYINIVIFGDVLIKSFKILYNLIINFYSNKIKLILFGFKDDYKPKLFDSSSKSPINSNNYLNSDNNSKKKIHRDKSLLDNPEKPNLVKAKDSDESSNENIGSRPNTPNTPPDTTDIDPNATSTDSNLYKEGNEGLSDDAQFFSSTIKSKLAKEKLELWYWEYNTEIRKRIKLNTDCHWSKEVAKEMALEWGINFRNRINGLTEYVNWLDKRAENHADNFESAYDELKRRSEGREEIRGRKGISNDTKTFLKVEPEKNLLWRKWFWFRKSYFEVTEERRKEILEYFKLKGIPFTEPDSESNSTESNNKTNNNESNLSENIYKPKKKNWIPSVFRDGPDDTNYKDKPRFEDMCVSDLSDDESSDGDNRPIKKRKLDPEDVNKNSNQFKIDKGKAKATFSDNIESNSETDSNPSKIDKGKGKAKATLPKQTESDYDADKSDSDYDIEETNEMFLQQAIKESIKDKISKNNGKVGESSNSAKNQ